MSPEPSDLNTLFAGLPVPSEEGLVFSTCDVPGVKSLKLGRSKFGPALLVPLDEVDTRSSPIELKHIALRPNAACRAKANDRELDGLYTVCLTTTPDTRLHAVFIDALDLLLPRLAENSDLLHASLEGLIDLFAGLVRAPATSVLGLWGEIFTIYSAAEPDLLLNGWHQLPGDHYDFAMGRERIEVKTATGRRQHSFSLEQLQPPGGTELVIASIVTESSAAGSSVRELIKATAARCAAPDALSRLLTGASKALGSSIGEWSGLRYDPQRASDSLWLLSSVDVPRPSVVSEAVFGVRFQVDANALAGKVITAGPRGDLVGALLAP